MSPTLCVNNGFQEQHYYLSLPSSESANSPKIWDISLQTAATFEFLGKGWHTQCEVYDNVGHLAATVLACYSVPTLLFLRLLGHPPSATEKPEQKLWSNIDSLRKSFSHYVNEKRERFTETSFTSWQSCCSPSIVNVEHSIVSRRGTISNV